MGLGDIIEAIAGLGELEPWRYGDTELGELVPALCAALHTLEVARVALLTAAEDRPIPLLGSYTGTTAWLGHTTSLSFAAAARIARLVTALRGQPEVAAAYRAGQLDADSAAVIVKFLERPPRGMPDDAIPAARDYLLEAARTGDTRELRVHIARLERVFEIDDPPPAEDTTRNELYTATTLAGRMRLTGDLDAETAEMLHAALSPLAKPRPTAADGRDPRTPAQRRADALTELLRRYHDDTAGPDDGGERPHLHLHINARDLADTPTSCPTHTHDQLAPDRGAYRQLFDQTGVGWLPWMGPLTVQTARALACDCVLAPIVLDEHGVPINLGRTARLVTRKLRRALIARDHGCAFPGCGRPPAWCDGHHIRHWIDGGTTDLDNLVLLCRHHHRLLHHSDWEIVLGTDRHPRFIPPATIDPARQPILAHGRASPTAA